MRLTQLGAACFFPPQMPVVTQSLLCKARVPRNGQKLLLSLSPGSYSNQTKTLVPKLRRKQHQLEKQSIDAFIFGSISYFMVCTLKK